jgi:hypothetical protein
MANKKTSKVPTKAPILPKEDSVTIFLSLEDVSVLVSILGFTTTCLDTLTAEARSTKNVKAVDLYSAKRNNCERLKNYLTDLALSGEPESRDFH